MTVSTTGRIQLFGMTPEEMAVPAAEPASAATKRRLPCTCLPESEGFFWGI